MDPVRNSRGAGESTYRYLIAHFHFGNIATFFVLCDKIYIYLASVVYHVHADPFVLLDIYPFPRTNAFLKSATVRGSSGSMQNNADTSTLDPQPLTVIHCACSAEKVYCLIIFWQFLCTIQAKYSSLKIYSWH